MRGWPRDWAESTATAFRTRMTARNVPLPTGLRLPKTRSRCLPHDRDRRVRLIPHGPPRVAGAEGQADPGITASREVHAFGSFVASLARTRYRHNGCHNEPDRADCAHSIAMRGVVRGQRCASEKSEHADDQYGSLPHSKT